MNKKLNGLKQQIKCINETIQYLEKKKAEIKQQYDIEASEQHTKNLKKGVN
jgi:hypothetical protein